MDARAASLPYMDVDELNEEIVGIDDAFLDNYLRGVEADAAVSGLLPSLNLDEAFWLDKPAQIQRHSLQLASGPSNASHDQPTAALATDAAPPLGFVGIGSSSGHSADDRSAGFDAAGATVSDDANFVLEPKAEQAPRKAAPKRSTSGAGRKVTPQRKQNNRKAQQRYREKRKAQAANLEQQVVSLTNELQALQTLKDQAAKVEGENAEQRAELDRLRKQMSGSSRHLSAEANGLNDSRASRDSDGSHPTVALDFSDDDVGPDGHHDHTVPPTHSYEDTVDEIMGIKREIQAVLRSAGLPDTTTEPGQQMDAKLDTKMRELITAAEKVSVRMLLMAPMCPMTKVLRHRAALGDAHPCSHFRSRWIKILAGLNLTTGQEEMMLIGRQELLDRLRQLYEERSQLNQVTMSIMLPRRSLHDDANDKMCDGTTEGKLKSAARYGAGCMLSQTAELVTALDRLKANLSAERRMLVQLHATLLRKVLSPLQAAVMFVQADTDPVEPLHISNLIAMNRGLVDQPPMLPALEPHEEEILMRPYSSLAVANCNSTNAAGAAASGAKVAAR